MKHVHVCLVSDQPIPNVTSCLQLAPERVELLYTRDKIAQALRIERLLTSRGVEVAGAEILPYDINNVISVCEQLFDCHQGCRMSLNITGGTKIGTLGAFQTFFSKAKEIYYVNTYNGEMIQISPQENSFPIDVNIPIRNYLDAHGFRIESWTMDDAFIYSRRPVTQYLSELAIRHPKLVGTLNSSFRDDVKRLTYPLALHLPSRELRKLIDLLDAHGCGTKKDETTFLIPDIATAQYLRGFWFEEYVYMAATSVPGVEVKLNVVGKWETRRSVEPKNEFDVLVGAGNRLLYISCKTSNPDRLEDGEGIGREYLYELDTLGDNALGLFGKKVLASARPIRDRYIHERAKALGIEIIDGTRIAEIPERIREWLRP